MEGYKTDFIDALVRHEALRFGDFTLKSGRKSPYFINAGQMRTGRAITGFGQAYAAAIERGQLGCDLVFGPAYKGVPLAVATVMGLAQLGRDIPYGFDRKEAKDHGEGGVFVGTAPADGMNVVIVDDVITSGLSIRQAVELIGRHANVKISGVVIAVDRQERGKSERSTLAELAEELQTPIVPIVSISEVVEYLHGRETENGTVVLDDARKDAVLAYLDQHGAKA